VAITYLVPPLKIRSAWGDFVHEQILQPKARFGLNIALFHQFGIANQALNRFRFHSGLQSR
jgi:hypothetical protein